MFLNVSNVLISSLPGAPALYIDPNTGGMLFQLLAIFLAFFSGILFFFSRQIKSFFARLRRSAREDVPTTEESEPEKIEQPAKSEEP
jgi:hypothetical protein